MEKLIELLREAAKAGGKNIHITVKNLNDFKQKNNLETNEVTVDKATYPLLESPEQSEEFITHHFTLK